MNQTLKPALLPNTSKGQRWYFIWTGIKAIGRVPKSFRKLSDLTPGVQPPAEANEKFH